MNRPTGYRGPSGGGRGREFQSDRPPEKTLEQLWPGYLEGGYFDEAGHLRPEYVSREKVDPLVQEMGRARPALTTTQLRRFFQHCRAIEARIRAKQATWEAVRADFAKLDVAAADAFGKSQQKIPRLFHDFIQRNVACVKSERDFLKGFIPHFEALVGFGAQHLKDKERN